MGAIYKALKYQVGELRHYVLANPDVSAFELASFERPPPRAVPATALAAIRVDNTNFLQNVAGLDLGLRVGQVPEKTPEYFRARYLQHPLYRYAAFVVCRGARPIGLLATRVAVHGDRCAIRVVDFVGLQLVGTRRVHPHRHYANYPAEKDRGFREGCVCRKGHTYASDWARRIRPCYRSCCISSAWLGPWPYWH
jgi:hypothetical protein